MREDRRKSYPTGARGSAGVDAETDEPLTKARAEKFAKIVGDTLVEARALVEERLRKAGYTALRVTIRDPSIDYWFDATLVYQDPPYDE